MKHLSRTLIGNNTNAVLVSSREERRARTRVTKKLIKRLEVDRAKAIANLGKSIYVESQAPYQREILDIDRAIRRLKQEEA